MIWLTLSFTLTICTHGTGLLGSAAAAAFCWLNCRIVCNVFWVSGWVELCIGLPSGVGRSLKAISLYVSLTCQRMSRRIWCTALWSLLASLFSKPAWPGFGRVGVLTGVTR